MHANPLLKLAGIDDSKLHVTFLAVPAPKQTTEWLKPLAGKSELFAGRGREIFLYCPAGYGDTKLSNRAIEKKLSVLATTRNWKTLKVLHTMAGA